VYVHVSLMVAILWVILPGIGWIRVCPSASFPSDNLMTRCLSCAFVNVVIVLYFNGLMMGTDSTSSDGRSQSTAVDGTMLSTYRVSVVVIEKSTSRCCTRQSQSSLLGGLSEDIPKLNSRSLLATKAVFALSFVYIHSGVTQYRFACPSAL